MVTALAALPQSIFGQVQYLGSLDENVLVRLVAFLLALGVAGLAVGPARLREWRRALVERRPILGDHAGGSSDYVDNRSQSMSNSPGGQQAFGDIINQGPQPRDISQVAGEKLVTELQKRHPEQFQISWMLDAEASELGTMLQGLLEQGGWQLSVKVPGAMVSGGPPRGIIVETTKDSAAVDTLISWLDQVNLNPKVNRKEHQFGFLTTIPEGEYPPVHVIVGVLPR